LLNIFDTTFKEKNEAYVNLLFFIFRSQYKNIYEEEYRIKLLTHFFQNKSLLIKSKIFLSETLKDLKPEVAGKKLKKSEEEVAKEVEEEDKKMSEKIASGVGEMKDKAASGVRRAKMSMSERLQSIKSSCSKTIDGVKEEVKSVTKTDKGDDAIEMTSEQEDEKKE